MEQYKFLEDIGYIVFQIRISDHRDWSIIDTIYACKKEIADSQKTTIDVVANSTVLDFWDSRDVPLQQTTIIIANSVILDF